TGRLGTGDQCPAARRPDRAADRQRSLRAAAAACPGPVRDVHGGRPRPRNPGPAGLGSRRRKRARPDRGRSLLRALGLAPARRRRKGRLGPAAVTPHSLDTVTGTAWIW